MRRVGALAGLFALVAAGQAHAGSYTLRWGDTLSRVARDAGVPVRTLARTNGISDADRVRAGRVLALGPGEQGSSRRPAALPPLPSPRVVAGGGGLHRVRPGETLAAIAARYRTSPAALARANGIKRPNQVPAGRALRVPGQRWLCPVRGADDRDFDDGWGAPRPGGRRHLGVDIFAPRGTPVVASVGGVIEHRPGSVAGLAYYLHGDDGHGYYGSHLQALVARPGRVERGQVIGRVGNTGNASGTPPHLHFEFKPGGGRAVNPYPTLTRWC